MDRWEHWEWRGELYMPWGHFYAGGTKACILYRKSQFYVSKPYDNSFHAAWHYSGPYDTLDAAKAAYLLLFDDALGMR